MNIRLLIVPCLILASSALAADLDTVPVKSIARKKELLFSDNFKSAEEAKDYGLIDQVIARRADESIQAS